MSPKKLTDPARSPDKSGGFPTVPPTASGERRESGQGQHDSPTPQWWRVHYQLRAAGGGLIPTWSEVVATSAVEAIEKAEVRQRRSDSDRGRAHCGYFKNASAETKPR